MSTNPPKSAKALLGQKIHQLCERLYPICRSITGDGVRQTLAILQEHIDLQIHELATDTPVFDWTVPKEWNINSAWIKGPDGKKIVDFATHNLHVLNYSFPVHQHLSLSELKNHLYSLPDQPRLIPYRTSYYKEQWGFCLSHEQLLELKDGVYEVFIDSTLEAGHLTYGEFYLPGKRKEEILFSAHVCHPSLANDNLAGISVLTHLAKSLQASDNEFSYRFIFIPGTIGSITWLSQNQDKLFNIKGGLVASLLGDPGDFTYKKSRQGDSEMDFVVQQVLQQSGYPHKVIDFIPYGYDERQFCAPAFNLAVGNLTRSQFGAYPEYHTSADDLEFVRPEFLTESYLVYRNIVNQLEENIYYKNLFPECEPQLGKRGLYDAIGGNNDSKRKQMAMLWILNYADGAHSLQRIAAKSGYDFTLIESVAKLLLAKGLLEKI